MTCGTLLPVTGHPGYAVEFKSGFFQILHQTARGHFEEDEEWSTRFGLGLLDAGIPSLNPAKIELLDLRGDGLLDVVVGTNDWSDYFPTVEEGGVVRTTRWSDPAYRPFEGGHWRGGPLHGQVFVFQNRGECPDDPEVQQFAAPRCLAPVDVYGHCTPVWADFTGDGCLDMVTGDFLHALWFFRGRGLDAEGYPVLAPGVQFAHLPGVINYCTLCSYSGSPDLLVGSENGYIYYVENLREVDPSGVPRFAPAVPLSQVNPPLKADVLAVPAIGPLGGPGSLALVSGTAAGHVLLSGDLLAPGPFAEVAAIGRILPPEPARGSIQGPSEIGWGYTAPCLFDWTGNGLLDIVSSDINGSHWVSPNEGSLESPQFGKPRPLLHDGAPLTTVWRVRPAPRRLPDGEVIYYCLDAAAHLTCYKKKTEYELQELGPVVVNGATPVQLTVAAGGGRGRLKLDLWDWDHTGSPDLLVGTPLNHDFRAIPGYAGPTYRWATVALLPHSRENDPLAFEYPQYLIHRELGRPPYLGHHSCSPAAFDVAGETHLLVGAEDGHFYSFCRTDFEPIIRP
jgi:hypothetical protein